MVKQATFLVLKVEFENMVMSMLIVIINPIYISGVLQAPRPAEAGQGGLRGQEDGAGERRQEQLKEEGIPEDDSWLQQRHRGWQWRLHAGRETFWDHP